jgi:hypothetical protein
MVASNKGSAAFAFATVVAVGVACGGQSSTDVGATDGSSGSSGSGDDASGSFNPPADAGFALDAFVGCAATTEQAKELPLDLYFMIDSSGSMNALVAPMKSKWQSVAAAMTAFVQDPASAGIGVGLQYFPLTQKGIPTSCTASSQCGADGPCFFNVCDTGGTAVYPCDSLADCPAGSKACVSIGVCHNDHNTVCAVGSGPCGPDPNGFALGNCDSITTSTCVRADSCTAADYATPAVPIALLPGNAAAVTASVAAHSPNGNTPTVAALQGAIDLAKTFATANPAHSVVAVLATDGIPDECTSQPTEAGAVTEIASVAAAGLGGTPRIKTFTIGVFTPDDIASGTSALDQIATAGGTSSAFIIKSTGNVEQQFTAALTAIRGASLPCQYQVPLPDSGMPDFTRVNVEYTSGAGVQSGLPYVESAARCGTGGGWYYDTDPTQGGTPRALFVCPTTCSTLTADTKGRVDVVIGCQTITR